MSQSEQYTTLLNFLMERGKSLRPFGSVELGLNKADAMQFLDLLSENCVPILGIEVWKSRNGKYSIESLSGWYAEGVDANTDYLEAKNIVASAQMEPNDVMTVQF